MTSEAETKFWEEFGARRTAMLRRLQKAAGVGKPKPMSLGDLEVLLSSLAQHFAPAHSRNKYMQEVAHKVENHELVSPDSIYSGHSSSQLLDARFSGCRCYLDYLLIRRTLKHAANSSTDQGGAIK